MHAITKIAAAIGLICVYLMSPVESSARDATKTPIHHLIVIVGENRSFDNLFATYRPKSGQRVAKSALRRDHRCERRAWAERKPSDTVAGDRSRSVLDCAHAHQSLRVTAAAEY